MAKSLLKLYLGTYLLPIIFFLTNFYSVLLVLPWVEPSLFYTSQWVHSLTTPSPYLPHKPTHPYTFIYSTFSEAKTSPNSPLRGFQIVLPIMPRASKRKSDSPKSTSAKSSRTESVNSALGKTSKFGISVDNLFQKYANKLLGMIDPEGIEALCSDLGVDHTNVRILMLAWKMKAEKQGYFTQDEWQRGLKDLGVDTINKLKKVLPKLEAEVMMPENFEDFYCYAFRYCLTEDKQKCVDIESICLLIDLVLGSQFRSQVDSFTEFLKNQTDYKVINMDQWTNFLRFCQEISFPDLKNYDTDQAWPVILDNFVDWMKEKQN
ncbi:uncharacterized protein LOC107801421 [Nicotiana tabacum]|uniref:Defective in cullin neddylation protein n=2 Tax=Nicotiana TaxID=4085 RepID=A0A1S4AU72_TOBAC